MNHLKIRKDFFQNGWAEIPKFISKKEIKLIKFEIKNITKKKIKTLKKGEVHFSKKKINTIHNLDTISKFFLRFKNKKKFHNLADSILGEKSEAQWVQLFAKPTKEGLAAPAHQDNYYWNIKDCKTITMWIALDKVDKTNGALYYYTKSHLKGRALHEASFAKGTSQTVKKNILKKIDKKTKHTITASPGDMFIHHGYTIHGSSKNLSKKSRKGISIWYKAKKAKIDILNMKKYRLSLKKQHQKLYNIL